YKVRVAKGTPKFLPIRVHLTDQFTSPPKAFDIKSPKLLCNPVDKRGEGIKHTDRHLACYRVTPTIGEPVHSPLIVLYRNNQFGPDRADTKKEDLLCLPSQATLPGATTTTTTATIGTSTTTTLPFCGTTWNTGGFPVGVAVDGSGNVYVGDYGSNRIEKFT